MEFVFTCIYGASVVLLVLLLLVQHKVRFDGLFLPKVGIFLRKVGVKVKVRAAHWLL